MSKWCVVVPYGADKGAEAGKKHLIRVEDDNVYLMVGELVICRKPSGYEGFYKVVVPAFSGDETVASLWGVNPRDTQVLIATLIRNDCATNEPDIHDDLPDIDE